LENRVISRDLPYIRQALSEFESYSFSEDIRSRMKALGLSSVALGNRAGVSHTVVDKWLKNKAKPNGKERMKELGMGLGMDTGELNRFLYRNGYPGLYVKNPLDSVAMELLRTARGREDMVSLYRELLDRLKLNRFTPVGGMNGLRTSVMLSGFMNQEDLSAWISAHRGDFVADAKTVLPDAHMGEFLRLYIGTESAYSLSVMAELPQLLVPVLTAILNGKSVSVRGLREKLIALGLYLNLTEEEIDALLTFVRLRPVSEPSSKSEMAVLLSLREAHEQYALYESENLERVLTRLAASQEPYCRALYADYALRAQNAEVLASYYLSQELSEEDREFRENYSSYGDRGLMDYVRDMLTALADSGELEKAEVQDFLENIRRNEEGDDSWT